MFNDKRYKDKIATYKQLRPFFVSDGLWSENRGILTQASPMATRTMGAFSKMLPLDDLSLRGEKGKIYITGEYNGKTRFGGFTVDQLVKAGIAVDVPGVILVAERGYVIGDANKKGSDYSIHFSSDINGLSAFYGGFPNNQLGVGYDYVKPGPAVPGSNGFLSNDKRFSVSFGYSGIFYIFGAAVVTEAEGTHI